MKEILIDGIDVSECKYLNKKYITCDNENTPNIGCEHCEDCYYKQLKRLEQKNEKLKQELKQINKDIKTRIMCVSCERELENCNLRIENEKLKEENTEYDEDLSIEKESHKSDIELLDRYRQALEEIREIWNEFKKLSPLEISFKQKQVYELDKAINNEVENAR